MEMFKTDILKKEFERFKKEVLVDVFDCDLCQKDSCQNHHRFFIECDRCRKSFCKPCKIFKSSKDSLFKNLDENGKKYLENFIIDFFNISQESFKIFFDKSSPIATLRPKTFDVKSYHKSNKNRSQVVYKKFGNCEKINYHMKGMKRSFYKKF